MMIKKMMAAIAVAGTSLLLGGCGGGEPALNTKPSVGVIADASLAGADARSVPRAVALSAATAAVNVLVNGTFEGGAAGWSASAGVLNTDSKAHAGASYAWLGGYNNAFDRISQSVTIPASSSSASLQFWYLITSSEIQSGMYDGMQVSVLDGSGAAATNLKLYTNQDKTDGWLQSPPFDLSAFAGKTVELRFTAVTDESEPSSFLVDDITLAVAAASGVAMTGNSVDYTIARSGNSFTVVPNSDGSGTTMVTVTAGERLNFADATVALDTMGVPAQVYRLYQAAFDRKPDAGGLGFHISAIEDSGLTLGQVAQNFINSPEFASLYGSNASNEQFVTRLYGNVLHRAPDAGGFAWHLARLASGVTRSEVLIFFSESPENQSNVADSISVGIVYTPLNRPTTPVAPVCIAPMVLQNGLCLTPVTSCSGDQVLRDGVCVAQVVSCVAPAVLTNGACVVPPPTCAAPKVLQNGLCVTPVTSCAAPTVLQDGVCVTPPPVAAPATPRALNGSVVLEQVVLGRLVSGQPWTYHFAWGGESSFYPELLNDLGETVTLIVCFAATNSSAPYGPVYFSTSCKQVPTVTANTKVVVDNQQRWAHGEFKVYAVRDALLDPTQQWNLVATYSALEWGFVSVRMPPPNCLQNGSIANTDPSCTGFNLPTPTPTTPPPPPPPPAGAGTGTGGAGSAQACVTTTRAGDDVTLHNNCGREIFFIWCGQQRYSSKTCGSTTNYFTSSSNAGHSDVETATIHLIPNGTYRFGACFGQIGFSNDGNFQAWSDGSYVCLK